jgi:hypothetical protein
MINYLSFFIYLSIDFIFHPCIACLADPNATVFIRLDEYTLPAYTVADENAPPAYDGAMTEDPPPYRELETVL